MLLNQAVSPSEDFERGKNAFGRGEYPRAIELLRPLLYPEIRLEAESQIVQAHRMLGEAHLFQKQNDEAAIEFRHLLQLRPDYRLDPLLDPPLVADFFNGIVREHESELATLDARHREAAVAQQRQRDDARDNARVVEKRYLRNSFAVNFIPFGAGQFQNGQRAKGWTFMVVESLLGAASIGALATNFALFGLNPKRRCLTAPPDGAGGRCPAGQIDYSQEDTSQRLRRVQEVSGWLFFASVAWGISDAILNFKPEVPLTTDEPRAARRVSRLALAPTLLGPSTLGPSLAFRF